MYNNPFLSPYGIQPQIQPAIPQQPAYQPAVQVVRVNGENGARAYQMGANSSALLLDESGTMVWLAITDGAGYKTVSAYDITPHQEAPAQDYAALETRITKLEELINGYSADIAAAPRGKHEKRPAPDQKYDEYAAERRRPAGHAGADASE